jgi:hypothetical protein
VKHSARTTLATPSADTVATEEVMAWARPDKRPGKPAQVDQYAQARRWGDGPTTGERDAIAAERELMRAMDEYRQKSGRMFPTWSEVFEVVQGLGYQKPA